MENFFKKIAQKVYVIIIKNMSTRYPIVLIHGAGGFDKLFSFTYFYKIEEFLRSKGYTVLVPHLTAYARIEKRAEEIKTFVESLGFEKVNIFGHSLGGVDARYAISKLGLYKKVASLTTISSPHHGSMAVDVILGLLPCKACQLADKAMKSVGWNFDVIVQMSKQYMEEVFNPNVPDVDEVKYYSWSAKASLFGKNRVKSFMLLLYLIIRATEGPNDGMVSVESAKWGKWLGVLEGDHYGVIGQPLGLTNFDYLGFFLSEMKRLEKEGF